MMEFAAILKGSQVMAEFLGLNSVSAFWYLCLWFGSFTWLFKRQSKILERNGELISQHGALLEKIKALHMRQDMQKDYVKEQELRYTEMTRNIHRMSADAALCKQLLDNNNIKTPHNTPSDRQ